MKKKPNIFNRFFNKKTKSDLNLNNSNNNNNCFREPRKSISNPELNDHSGKNLHNYNISTKDIYFLNYADAKVTVNYFLASNTFSLQFFSILNLSTYRLSRVNVLIDVFYEDKFYKRLVSKAKPICLNKLEERPFEANFLIEFNKMNRNKIKMNIFIVGLISYLLKGNFIQKTLNSNKLQPLGGANILLEKLLE